MINCLLRKYNQELIDYIETTHEFHICQDVPIIKNKEILAMGNEIIIINQTPPHYNPANIIDCGTNEQFFKALIALNKENDKACWFISNTGEWFLNWYNTFNIELAKWICDFNCSSWRKATVEEIIKKFNPI